MTEMGSKEFSKINMGFSLKCQTVPELKIYEFMEMLDSLNQKKIILDRSLFLSPGEIDEETLDVTEEEVRIDQITADLLNCCIKNILSYGYSTENYFHVINEGHDLLLTKTPKK